MVLTYLRVRESWNSCHGLLDYPLSFESHGFSCDVNSQSPCPPWSRGFPSNVFCREWPRKIPGLGCRSPKPATPSIAKNWCVEGGWNSKERPTLLLVMNIMYKEAKSDHLKNMFTKVQIPSAKLTKFITDSSLNVGPFVGSCILTCCDDLGQRFPMAMLCFSSAFGIESSDSRRLVVRCHLKSWDPPHREFPSLWWTCPWKMSLKGKWPHVNHVTKMKNWSMHLKEWLLQSKQRCRDSESQKKSLVCFLVRLALGKHKDTSSHHVSYCGPQLHT